MLCAKNYKIASTFVKVMQRILMAFCGQELMSYIVSIHCRFTAEFVCKQCWISVIISCS